MYGVGVQLESVLKGNCEAESIKQASSHGQIRERFGEMTNSVLCASLHTVILVIYRV